MITNLHIENFKSIENMDLPLGNLNILIGENGCGKTNILEAAAIGVAAAKDKLDNEYYFARGIRKTENRFMKSAFAEEKAKEPIIINFSLESGESIDFRINENAKGQLEDLNKIELNSVMKRFIMLQEYEKAAMLRDGLSKRQENNSIIGGNFIIYAPENTFLRKFEEEGQTDGLGFRGEGLFDELQHIKNLAVVYSQGDYDIELSTLLAKQKDLKMERDAVFELSSKLFAELEKKETQIEELSLKKENLNLSEKQLEAEIQKIISENLLDKEDYKNLDEEDAIKYEKVNKEWDNLDSERYNLASQEEKLEAEIKELLKEIEKNTFLVNVFGVKRKNLSAEITNLKNRKAAFEQLPKIKAHLRELLDWFEDFEITGSNMERKLYIKDRFLPEKTLFDQKSANEGFLLLLFYLTLFTGAETPSFFAIDNIDTGLNPKLGSRLIEILAKLAKEHNKQAIITTHNPAILDGLDLRDDAQRLFVVSRNRVGKTKIERVENQQIMENGTPLKLSEKFMRGYIGGLPKNF